MDARHVDLRLADRPFSQLTFWTETIQKNEKCAMLDHPRAGNALKSGACIGRYR